MIKKLKIAAFAFLGGAMALLGLANRKVEPVDGNVLTQIASEKAVDKDLEDMVKRPELEVSMYHPIQHIPEDLDSAIARIEDKLRDTNAIERLNAGSVGPEVRAKISDDLKNLDQLRAQRFELHLREMEEAVANLEAHHEERLITYGLAP